eukprot:Nk52_evm11s233 gene=Nk52_evmTU11s233
MSVSAVTEATVKKVAQSVRRLRLTYCPKHIESAGVRLFVNEPEQRLVGLAKTYPSVVFKVECVPGTTKPSCVADYFTGLSKTVQVNKYKPDEIAHTIDYLFKAGGHEPKTMNKPHKTESPSVQGQWNPFMYATKKEGQGGRTGVRKIDDFIDFEYQLDDYETEKHSLGEIARVLSQSLAHKGSETGIGSQF